MGFVNVLVTSSIGDECLRQIKMVSPKVKLVDASHLARAEQAGNFTSKDEFDALLAEVEIVYGFRFPKDFIARTPKLKWVQMMSAGVDRFLDNAFLESPVTMTNVSGIHANPDW